MYELKEMLCEITGMDDMTLQPAAGAHGELTGMLIVREYFKTEETLGERKFSYRILHTVLIQHPLRWLVLRWWR